MRITLKTDGGIGHFPELARPIVADTDVLTPELSARLRELVEHARFFQLPETIGTKAPGLADVRTHTLTVEDGPRRHRVVVLETAISPAVRALVEFEKAHGARD